MKRLVACIAAMLMAITLSALFSPAQAATNPSDGLNYDPIFNTNVPSGQHGSDSDKNMGIKFTVNSPGVIAGQTFYKFASDNNQGYARWAALYKWQTGSGGYWERVRLGYDPLEYANSPYSDDAGWRNIWFSTPLTVAAGEQYMVSINSRNGYYSQELNAFANGATITANGLTATGAAYTYGNTSGSQYLPLPTTASNTNYKTSPLFRQSTPTYPAHTNIVATTFWVGEVFNSQLTDGSQVCSAYDGEWAKRWSSNEPTIGNAPAGTDCEGSPIGGCDGVYGGTTVATFTCDTQARTSSNNYLPTGTNTQTPAENHFYLDLPYDDVNDTVAFAERCSVIPWAAAVNAQLGVNKCTDSSFSYMKNRWVKMTRGSNVCYGQIQDAGPSTGTNYHDKAYVFGSNDARPLNQEYSGDPTQGAGADVSPALVGCLGFTNLNGDTDHMDWQFVERSQVPSGPWTLYETTSQVNW